MQIESIINIKRLNSFSSERFQYILQTKINDMKSILINKVPKQNILTSITNNHFCRVNARLKDIVTRSYNDKALIASKMFL